MAKKQTRRSVSVTGATYEAIRLDCEEREISLSEYIESLIEGDRQARGLPAVAVRSEHAREVGRAIAAGRRAARKQVEQAVEAVRAAAPLPAESKIVAGPPPEQTAMLGRAETPKRGDAMRAIDHAHTLAAIARRKAAGKAPPPIPAGRDASPSSGHASARPAHGDRVPPPQPGRGPGNVVAF